MSMGRSIWKQTRQDLIRLLSKDEPTLRDNHELRNRAFVKYKKNFLFKKQCFISI